MKKWILFIIFLVLVVVSIFLLQYPKNTMAQPGGGHYTIWIYVTLDGSPINNATVKVTNLANGQSDYATHEPSYGDGWYGINLANNIDWGYGDVVLIEAFYNGYYGNNTTLLTTQDYSIVNVTLQPLSMPSFVYVDDDWAGLSNGTTVYVNGTPHTIGYDAFAKIQDGINAVAVNGTVYVFNGTYYENVAITKKIRLIGENRNTTIIDGGGVGDTVHVYASQVYISNLTMQNCGESNAQYDASLDLGGNSYCQIENCNFIPPGLGIFIQGNYNIFRNCNVSAGSRMMFGSNYNTMYNCVFPGPKRATRFGPDAVGNRLINCTFMRHICWCGAGTASYHQIINCTFKNINFVEGAIQISGGGENNIIKNCVFINCSYGIFTSTWAKFRNSIICNNTFINCNYGIYIQSSNSNNNQIYHNNFINNTWNAYDTSFNIWYNNTLQEGNYWSDFDEPSEGAYDNNSDGIIDSPYYILGGSNMDRYPLTHPTIIPSIVYVDDDFNSSTPGWGYDHFNKIQDGINAVAENGNVYVYNGTYEENLLINKSIRLVGENTTTTVIQGLGDGIAIHIVSDNAYINGFTIINEIMDSSKGIQIESNYNKITNCSIYHSAIGILVTGFVAPIYNNISYCRIHNNTDSGIYLNGMDTTVYDCVIENNFWGIEARGYKDGSDEFNYTIKDNDGAVSNVANVVITVLPVNDPPVANDDYATTNEDIPVVIDVLANDSDVEDGVPEINAIISQPSHGIATINPNGTITYEPNENYCGGDSFVYEVIDSDGLKDNATVHITVLSVNDPPVASDDSYTTDEDVALVVSAPGVLSNDNDVDGDTLSAELISNPSHGSLTFNSDGSFVYTPDENYYGTDSFTYKAYDGSAYSNEATVIITINPVNDPPVANFTWTPQNPTTADVVQFTDLSYDIDGYIVNWTWNFGDGSYAYEQNPQHQYSNEGTYNVTLTIMDNDGAMASITKQIIVELGNTPPFTSCIIGGKEGENGWYVSPVTISFTAYDEDGINATYYRIGGEWKKYRGMITIGGEGIYVIEYYSVDNLGMAENIKTKTIKIAMSKPHTSCQLDGLLGENGWYISNVTVSFIRGGTPAGIAYTKYRLDGGEWQIYNGSFIVSEEGEHVLEYYSEDMAGNVEDVKSTSFKIDKFSPEVQVIYPNGGETLSGVITIQWEASDTVDSDLSISLYYSQDGLTWREIASNIENTGSYNWDTTGLPLGDYWIKVTAEDDAGHVGEDTSDGAFTIVPTSPLSIEITKPNGYLYVMDRAIIRLPVTVVIGGITIEVETHTEIGIDKIELLIDNEVKYSSNEDYTTYSWYYDEATIGFHEIEAIAYDIIGQKATASVKAFFFNL